jgi:hypothetical protein
LILKEKVYGIGQRYRKEDITKGGREEWEEWEK